MSDILTRLERIQELLDQFPDVRDIPLVLPPIGESWEDLTTWARTIRDRADEDTHDDDVRAPPSPEPEEWWGGR